MTTITPTSSTPSPSSTNSGSNALASFSNNFQSFLTLLTTQLQNQDPLNPMDSTQFTSQLVQFTGVEQGILQNQNLQQLITLQTNNQMSNAAGYIGMQVNGGGNQVQLAGGTAAINYTLTDATTAKVTITIKDSNGNVINTLTETPTQLGPQSVSWDGKNSNGTVVPDGTYSINIQGFNSQNNPVSVTAGETGIVTGVSLVNGQVMLTTQGGQQIPISDVTSVAPPSSSG
ncbi:MAG TPA: flagellar hook capping FlgD N-terminal domain-containing protein [Alphaproteobacteria bacterium]|nr:flagellar hook capping FlgD N-terminal domain-containing protein [Alphaproteobacteria bacterium]